MNFGNLIYLWSLCFSKSSLNIWKFTVHLLLKPGLENFEHPLWLSFQMFKVGFKKGRGTRDQIANICWIIKKAIVPEKHLLLLYWLCQSLWLCGSQYTGKFWKKMGIPDHLTCLLRNLYAGQEATARTGYGTTDWFQIGKGVHQGCILSPLLI